MKKAKNKKSKSQRKSPKRVSGSRKTKNPRKAKISKNKKPNKTNIRKTASKKTRPQKKINKQKNTPVKTPKKKEQARMKRKKIDGRWREVYYLKDPKGKIHQRYWGDYRTMTEIKQPKNIKQSRKTMTKQLPPNFNKGLKNIAKDSNEHSIAMDFERRGTHPQRVIIMKGGRTETLKINDFEYFGHTHPHMKQPTPSLQDLRGLKPLAPEFVIAGGSGKTNIYNVENQERLRKHLINKATSAPSSWPVEAKDIERQKKRKKWQNQSGVDTITPHNITETKKGREMFFDITGVKAYPLKEKATYVEMKDDPKLEKQVPTIPKEYLEKYHQESGVK